MTDKPLSMEKLLAKANSFKKENQLDLSSDEDLSIAVMNLVSLEEHFFFTGAKTGKLEYYDLLNQTRQIRKKLMKKLIRRDEGEIWCVQKHLLAASMRLIEAGTKHLNQEEKQGAQDLFSKAYELYSLFWGINLKIIALGEIKKIENSEMNTSKEKPAGLFIKLGEIVKKIINCCKE